MKAMWKGTTIAESGDTVIVEDNHYFPRESVNMKYLRKNDETYQCSWKGEANYFDVVVGKDENQSAAWVYESPEEAASNIKGRIAFWRGVEVK
jgi:uncharacterized protein (DUF427 family)